MIEMIKENATIIQAASALISALAVLISTWFIIWTTCFRKTRRDRMDELKVEIGLLLSDGWYERIRGSIKELDNFFNALNPKFQKPKYKVLHQYAFDELGYEGKNKVTDFWKKMDDALAGRF